MWLSVCGDPQCPNKTRVEELEAEVARLKKELAAAQEARQRAEDERDYVRPRFKYPE